MQVSLADVGFRYQIRELQPTGNAIACAAIAHNSMFRSTQPTDLIVAGDSKGWWAVPTLQTD